MQLQHPPGHVEASAASPYTAGDSKQLQSPAPGKTAKVQLWLDFQLAWKARKPESFAARNCSKAADQPRTSTKSSWQLPTANHLQNGLAEGCTTVLLVLRKLRPDTGGCRTSCQEASEPTPTPRPNTKLSGQEGPPMHLQIRNHRRVLAKHVPGSHRFQGTTGFHGATLDVRLHPDSGCAPSGRWGRTLCGCSSGPASHAGWACCSFLAEPLLPTGSALQLYSTTSGTK